MKRTRTRILEDMLIHREKIKTDSNSLKVENTAEDLNASITCIESNKLEQEIREGYNKVNETQMTACVNVDKIENGVITSSVLSTSTLNNISVNINNINIETGDYYISCDIRLKSGNCEKINSLQMIGNINQDSILSTEIISFPDISNEFKRYIRKYTIADTVTENEEALRFLVQATNCENAVFEIKNIQISRENKEYEQFGQSPSTKYKSEVLGVTGDVNLKVQNKNYANNIKYLNQTQNYLPAIVCDVQYQKNQYYIVSFDTPNTDDTVYINQGIVWGIRKVTPRYSTPCDGTRKYYVIQALETITKKNINFVNKTNEHLDVSTGLLSNFMIEKIKALTDEEALEYVSSKYVEHKEQNFTISLGDKTLYKGDKIVRQNGKWYFVHNEYNKYIMDGITHKFEIKTSSVNNNQYYSNNINNIKVASDNSEILDIYSNMFLKNSANELYTGRIQQGISIQIDGKIAVGLGLDIGIDTVEKANTWLQTNNLEVIYPLATPEPELIEDENLMKQLDAILMYMTEYEELTNFDFDQNVTFEIEVEKDNIRLLNARLDELEKQSITTSALALESEV